MQKISSLALAFAFVMPLAGCPAGDDTGTETMAETGTMPTTTEAETETPATDTGMTTTADTGMTTTADTGMTTGSGGGFCAQACEAVADCVIPGTNEADWGCDGGFCTYNPPPVMCDDTNCPAAAGFACADVNGENVCTIPCPNGNECDVLMQECTGMDDAGTAICEAPPPEPCGGVAEGEPCEIPMFGQFGTCTDGVCSCSDDAECTAEGYACNSGG